MQYCRAVEVGKRRRSKSLAFRTATKQVTCQKTAAAAIQLAEQQHLRLLQRMYICVRVCVRVYRQNERERIALQLQSLYCLLLFLLLLSAFPRHMHTDPRSERGNEKEKKSRRPISIQLLLQHTIHQGKRKWKFAELGGKNSTSKTSTYYTGKTIQVFSCVHCRRTQIKDKSVWYVMLILHSRVLSRREVYKQCVFL